MPARQPCERTKSSADLGPIQMRTLQDLSDAIEHAACDMHSGRFAYTSDVHTREHGCTAMLPVPVEKLHINAGAGWNSVGAQEFEVGQIYVVPRR